MKRLVVRGKDWFCNLPVTKTVLDGDTVFAYLDGDLVGFFDLGIVDALWVSEKGGGGDGSWSA